MKQIFRPVLMVLVGLMVFSATFANILYVKPGAGSSVWQEKSNVYTDLQVALASATSGDQIWVAGGTYKPTTGTDRSISFQLKDGVELYGGFAGDETELSQRNWRENETILSGDIGEVGIDTDNSYHLIQTEFIENISPHYNYFIDGFIIQKGYDLHEGWSGGGAGVLLNTGSFVFSNLWFRDNYSDFRGGAVNDKRTSNAVFINVIFSNNIASSGGGAFSHHSDYVFYNCVWYKNSAKHYGGATSRWVSDSNSRMLVVNSIAWENSSEKQYANFHVTSVKYSIVKGGQEGEGNSDVNPMLIDPENGDFRVSYNSPALFAGNPDYFLNQVKSDFAGEPRLTNGEISIGLFQEGIVNPTNKYPKDNTVIDRRNSITLEWEWPNSYPEPEDYKLEYIVNSNEPIIIINILEHRYVINIEPGSKVKWRVAGNTNGPNSNWSVWTDFHRLRNHPIYVTSEASGTGTSWNNPTDLQTALTIAHAGDEIWVKEGIYRPTFGTDRSLSFLIKEGVKLYGGFKGNEYENSQRNWILNPTILCGNIGEQDNEQDNSNNVVRFNGTNRYPISDKTELDGFIIENGNTELTGAGIFMTNASPKILNCRIQNNVSTNVGGGVYSTNYSNAIFANVIFFNNQATREGGGLYAARFSKHKLYNCLFYSNSSRTAAAIYTTSKPSIFLYNSILWNNKRLFFNDASDNYITAYYSVLDNPNYEGSNNIYMDPLFYDSENEEFWLRNNSPAIGMGNREFFPDFLTSCFSGSLYQKDNIDIGPFQHIEFKTLTPKPKGGLNEYKAIQLGTFIWGYDSPYQEMLNLNHNRSRILVWEKGEEDHILHDEIIEYSDNGTQYVWETLLGELDFEKQYEWKVALIINNQEMWSKTAQFYIGHDHVIHVKAGSDGTNGTNWANAFGTLHEALEYALPGDEIWVAGGTYYPVAVSNASAITIAERETSLQLKPGISIYGGFAGTEMSRNHRNHVTNPTIISGDLSSDGNVSNSSKHLFVNTGTPDQPIEQGAVIDGFVFEFSSQSAVVNNQASPTITNSIFRNNKGINGGAISNTGSSPLLYQVLFHKNEASTKGGAIWSDNTSLPELINVTIGNNQATETGGVYGPAIVKNSIAFYNTGDQVTEQATVVSSCIEGGFEGDGVVDYDPMWMDMAGGDFRLQEFSSAIDGGNQSLLPEMPVYDLAIQGRLMHQTIDMGAYEAQAKGSLIFDSWSADNNKMHRNDTIIVRFNQPVSLFSENMIQLAINGIEIPIVVTIENGDIVIAHDGLEFSEAYQLTIPASAIAFEGNLTILNQIEALNFSTLNCQPAEITSLVSTLKVCPYDALEIVVPTKGDVNGFSWIFNNESLQVNSDTLVIPIVSPDKLGAYTLEVEDHCHVGTSQQVTIEPVETTQLNIVDKWGTVFLLDNQSDQLSDYSWYLNDILLSNSQYVAMRNSAGLLTVHAVDEMSGCVLRSEAIDLSGRNRSAMVVWPNPVHAGNRISVVMPHGFEASRLKLLDITGRLMVDEKAVYNTQIDFDKTHFIPGIYILLLEDDQGNIESERITID
jgi:predicted outer membrane repeat protein